jgi:RNA polymerase sigma factor (sigma-70 family)
MWAGNAAERCSAVTDTSLAHLKHVLIAGYEQLTTRLAQRLGSSELAADAVQDTWLRLHRLQTGGVIENPRNYLFRVALNLARDQLARDRRYVNFERSEAMDMIDDAAGPSDTVEMRSDLMRVEQLMAELPPRQRAILVAARLDGLPRSEIAKRLGVSLSTVEKELKQAHEYCLSRLMNES